MSVASWLDETLIRRARQLEALWKARREVDVAGLAAGVRARLESQLQLRQLPVEADLADKPGPLGWGRVRTLAFTAPRFRKVVLTQVALPPVVEGFALVLLPLATIDAPIFGGDLMALPTRVSINADIYGVHEATRAAAREILEPLGESFVRLGTGRGPAWADSISSGVGLHTKLGPRLVEGGFAAFGSALMRYLDDVERARPRAQQAGDDEQRELFRLFHANGPRNGAMGRVMPSAWAERWSHLCFE